MYRVVGRGRVACIGLGPGLDLKLGNSTSIFGPRTQTQAWQFELELDIELVGPRTRTQTKQLKPERDPELGNFCVQTTPLGPNFVRKVEKMVPRGAQMNPRDAPRRPAAPPGAPGHPQPPARGHQGVRLGSQKTMLPPMKYLTFHLCAPRRRRPRGDRAPGCNM